MTGATVPGGFAKQLAYLGGHPEYPLGMTGTLALVGDILRWVSERCEVKKPLGWAFIRMRPVNAAGMTWEWSDERFEIDIADIVRVETKTKRELQEAPQGYLNVFGIIGHGYGQDEKHPLEQMHGAFSDFKLLALMAVTFRLGVEEHTAVFVNHPRRGDDTLRVEGNIITSAAHAKRVQRRDEIAVEDA